MKAYRIYPTSDMHKWARICEHIIRHYNEGWANGFHYGIKYWEIWNEPDGDTLIENNAMWKVTKEEIFNLYRITTNHLRYCFGDTLKTGGYASCGFYAIAEETDAKVGSITLCMKVQLSNWEIRSMGFVTFFEEFLELVKKENLPFDFFSYHSYASINTNIKMQDYAEMMLGKYGFHTTEIHLNEWNPNPKKEARGKLFACSNALGMMCVMQNKKMDIMCYYDARIGVSVYGGLFNPLTFESFHIYYGFKAFGELYSLESQVERHSDTDNVYALTACNGQQGKVLVINNKGQDEIISSE